jgi:hypothetical protein
MGGRIANIQSSGGEMNTSNSMKTRNGPRSEGPSNNGTGLGWECMTVIDSYKQMEVPWKTELKIRFVRQRPSMNFSHPKQIFFEI